MIRALLIIFVSCIFSTSAYSQNEKQKQEVEPVYTYIEVEAEFPGGEKAWKRFLDTNFAKLNVENFFPNPKADSTVKVIMEFTIDTAGNALIKIPEQNKLLFFEIKRIFAKASAWSPAVKNGKKVSSYRRQPITIILPHNED